MTQKDFIKKFEQICQKNDFKFIEAKDWTYGVQMCYINNQDDEIVNEYVAEIGFDVDNDFYIDFCDGCTAFEEDLECNREDAWDLLYCAILDDIFGLDSADDEHDFKAGDAVYWNDPAIDDYPEEEREEALKRRFVVFDVSGEIISISDTYTTAEVYASELEHIS
jgi:hypothetical protein